MIIDREQSHFYVYALGNSMPTFAQIKAEKDLLLVDFSIEWCGPC